MSDAPRQTLRDLVARYGPGLCSDARRCEGLLRDLCGAHRREINILISALKERVPLDLLAAQSAMPRGLLLSRLAKRLEDQLALTEEAARWAVESWALALGVVTDAELQDRQRQTAKAAPPPPPARTVGEGETEKTAGESAPRAAPPAATQTRQPHGGRPAQQTAPPPPQAAPPTRQAGRRTTSPLPPPPSPPPLSASPPQSPRRWRAGRGPFSNWVVRVGPRSGAPQTTGAAPQQQGHARGAPPDPRARRGGRTLRGCAVGCLLLVLLSVALFLGVPFVVSVLREEQQRRVNEPPPAMSQ